MEGPICVYTHGRARYFAIGLGRAPKSHPSDEDLSRGVLAKRTQTPV